MSRPDRTNFAVLKIDPVPAPADLNEILHSLKTVASTQSQRMAEAYVRIAEEIEKARQRVAVSKLKTFLVSECGLNRSDLAMYLRFTDTLGQHAKTLIARGLPMTVAKSLVARRVSMLWRFTNAIRRQSRRSWPIAGSVRCIVRMSRNGD